MTKTRRLLTATIAGALLLTACGDDDDSADTTAATGAPATEAPLAEEPESEPTEAPPVEDPEPEPVTTEAMTDDEMTDEEMTDEGMTDTATGVLVEELTAAGLGADQAQCVVDGAVAEWGADALLAAGSATDQQLVRLAEITFDCIG